MESSPDVVPIGEGQTTVAIDGTSMNKKVPAATAGRGVTGMDNEAGADVKKMEEGGGGGGGIVSASAIVKQGG